MAFRDYSLKKKILIMLAIVLIALLFLFSLYFLYRVFTRQPALPQIDGQGAGDTSQAFQPTPPPVFSPETATKFIDEKAFEAEEEMRSETQSVLVIARAFAERFGSFSNQSEFSNFDDIMIFTTSKMGAWMSSHAQSLREEYPLFGQYYGSDTKVISSEVSIENNTAEILFTTQRQEFSDEDLDPKPYYQDLKLLLIKDGDAWLVDGAFWQ